VNSTSQNPTPKMSTLDEVKRVGYLVTNSKRLRGGWFAECKINRRPFIVIWMWSRWASVSMDLRPAQHRLTDVQAASFVSPLAAAARCAFKAGARGYIHLEPGEDHVSISKCVVRDGLELAKAFLDEALQAPEIATRRGVA
jgi:hypothetical protein